MGLTFFETVKEIESRTARKLAATYVEHAMKTVALVNAYYGCRQLIEAPLVFGRAESDGLYEDDGNTPSPGVRYSVPLAFRLYYCADEEIFPFTVHDSRKCGALAFYFSCSARIHDDVVKRPGLGEPRVEVRFLGVEEPRAQRIYHGYGPDFHLNAGELSQLVKLMEEHKADYERRVVFQRLISAGEKR